MSFAFERLWYVNPDFWGFWIRILKLHNRIRILSKIPAIQIRHNSQVTYSRSALYDYIRIYTHIHRKYYREINMSWEELMTPLRRGQLFELAIIFSFLVFTSQRNSRGPRGLQRKQLCMLTRKWRQRKARAYACREYIGLRTNRELRSKVWS